MIPTAGNLLLHERIVCECNWLVPVVLGRTAGVLMWEKLDGHSTCCGSCTRVVGGRLQGIFLGQCRECLQYLRFRSLVHC
jgi:hypothetical protein